MEIRELRIGNLVHIGGHNTDITDLLTNPVELYASVSPDYGYMESDVQPIPLTEEWLLKFGFELSFDEYWVSADGELFIDKLSMRMVVAGATGYEYYYSEVGKRIKFVHQLQNLYFALTSEELEIKNQVEI